MSQQESSPKLGGYSMKDFQVVAGFIVTILMGGILWQTQVSRVDTMEKQVDAQGKTIEVLASASTDTRERTVRLETQYQTILQTLQEIKQEIKSQSK